LKAIRVGDQAHWRNAVTLRYDVAPKLADNFLTVDLGSTRAAFESMPGPRRMVQHA
jgi:hypothetical protein